MGVLARDAAVDPLGMLITYESSGEVRSFDGRPTSANRGMLMCNAVMMSIFPPPRR